jgi:hypothetical protein
MAFQFSTNTIPATNAACVYLFITTLLAQGWTKPKDSDGTTYSSTGVQVTGAGVGAHGLNNNSAWFVLVDPNGVRSLCLQRNGSGNTFQWRFKYSASALFIGGAPSGTQVPSATDEIVVIGGGTDAAPTFAQIIFGTEGTSRCNICAGDATVGYSFWWDMFVSGGVNGTHYGMMLDVMAPGSFPSVDTDPAVLYLVGGGTGATTPWGSDLFVTNTNAHAFYSNTHTAANWKNTPALCYMDRSANTSVAPGVDSVHFGANPFTGLDDIFPVMYGRSGALAGAPVGYKGFGLLLRCSGNTRTNYDTLSVAAPGSREYIYLSAGAALRWDGSIPLT